jgi:hypothetical protein
MEGWCVVNLFNIYVQTTAAAAEMTALMVQLEMQ